MAVECAALVALFESVQSHRDAFDASRERLAAVLDYRAEVLEELAGAVADEAHGEQCLILAEQARTRASMIRQSARGHVSCDD